MTVPVSAGHGEHSGVVREPGWGRGGKLERGKSSRSERSRVRTGAGFRVYVRTQGRREEGCPGGRVTPLLSPSQLQLSGSF